MHLRARSARFVVPALQAIVACGIYFSGPRSESLQTSDQGIRMNRIPSELPHNGSGQTLTVPANRGLDGRGRSTSEPRRCMALVPGSGTPLTYEVHCLLRRRLRVAGLIAWSAASIFLVRNWLIEGSADGPTGFEMAMHALVVAILSLVTGLLWSRIDLTPRALRGAELALFGALAVYFAILQFNVFHHGELFRGVGPEATDRILTIAAHANSLRWFVIITLYGTFIPNTWKRCTAVVAVLVAMPVLLNFFICFRCPVMGEHTWTATFDPLVILGTGAAIAIFGSYKLSSLQAEAFAAKKLGQYQLRQLLGSGGMGEVYLGEHTLLRRACAIKIIRADQAGDPTTLSRFEREVRAMATLTHWNTVEIYDYGRADDGTFYYVMEYLPGPGRPLPAPGLCGPQGSARHRFDSPRHQAEQCAGLRARRSARCRQTA